MYLKVKFKNSIISMFSTAILIMLAYIVFNYAPFGNKSFAVMDAQIQYLDFFSFLKNVFKGKDSILYSFNATLGGPTIGIFGYYLASPINLLLKFVNDENVFLNIATLIKLSIASFTFSYFLEVKFGKKLKTVFNVILAVSYSLMQYSLAQASNIMWLDGIYMLPLICIGVDKVIKNKNIHFLSIAVGLSIIFNWYTGGINCVFSAFYFIFELIMYKLENKCKISEIFKRFFTYAIAMVIGVMISSILFIPVVFSLMGGKGGSFDFALIKNEFYGNIISTMVSYHMGSVSTSQSLSIYCGAFPVIGILLIITANNMSIKKKTICTLMLLIMIFTCYYTPFFILFSLFKNSTSYYFRYSYVIIFTMIYISAFGYINFEKTQKNRMYYCVIMFSIILVVLQFIVKSTDIKYVYATIFFLLVDTYIVFRENKLDSRNFYSMLIICLCFVELLLNMKIMFRSGSSEILYKNYSESQQKQIDKLKEYDNSNYRINQTLFRNYENENELPAYYNDALAYNYMSISGYTSSPDNNALELLSNMGYRTEGECITIVNTSILPVDSLLGVKYILSNYEINGLEKIKDLGEYNGKSVYYNKYALNISFATNELNQVNYEGNSFEYINNLYSSILGEKIEIYEKVTYRKDDSSNINGKNYRKYIIKNENNENRYPIYAYFPWINQFDGKIYVNDKYVTQYAKWLSPQIVYIPTDEKQDVKIEIKSENEIEIGEEQIYFVNLEKLKYATEKINKNKVEQMKLEKNKIIINYNNINNMKDLLITVPYAKGCALKINGQEYEIGEYNKIMDIKLLNGENNIELIYKTPGLKLGISISCIGMVIIIMEMVYVRKRGKKIE